MMEYFRGFLILIRRKENTNEKKLSFKGQLLLVFLLSFLIGSLVDFFLPFNFILNLIRGIISLTQGLSLFSYMYLLWKAYRNQKEKEDTTYLSVRKRFTFRQRKNISILIGVSSLILIIINTNPNPLYTIKSSLVIVIWLILLAFSRRERSEFIKDVYDIPDPRDLEFMNREKKIKKKKKKKKRFKKK